MSDHLSLSKTPPFDRPFDADTARANTSKVLGITNWARGHGILMGDSYRRDIHLKSIFGAHWSNEIEIAGITLNEPVFSDYRITIESEILRTQFFLFALLKEQVYDNLQRKREAVDAAIKGERRHRLDLLKHQRQIELKT